MTRHTRRSLPLLMLLLAAGIVRAQQAPPRDGAAPKIASGTALLSGIVLNEQTGRPVRRAVVTLGSSDLRASAAVVTDDTGTFSFADLPAARYSLGVGRPGFVSMSYGAKRPNRPGSNISLAAAERRTGIELRMSPGAVISGVVRSQAGDPVSGARIIVLRPSVSYDIGERTLSPVNIGFAEATDDRGIYRVYGLPAGDYYVVVAPSLYVPSVVPDLRAISTSELEWALRLLANPSAVVTPPPTPARSVNTAAMFYPGSPTQAGASIVSLKAGEERQGIDVTMSLVQTSTLTGTVVSNEGPLPDNLQLNIIAHDTIPGIPFAGFGSARVDANGKFVSGGLTPGDYTVTVRVGNAGRGGAVQASTQFGMSTVSISGDDAAVTVRLESGVEVSGTLVFNGDATKPPTDFTKIRVTLTPVRSRTPTLGVPGVTADAEGHFIFKGVTPGRYNVSASGAPTPWLLRSAIANGADALDAPITVDRADVGGIALTFSDRSTELTGDLLDAAGKPVSDYFIIVYAADRKFWTPSSRRIQSLRPATDGRFRVANLPPGDYLIAAVTDVEQGEWYDPSFLAQLVDASTKITLAEGEKKVQSLKIGGSLLGADSDRR